ncbi:hypothetical protein [Actinokineospora cianjurensis]|uniref:Acyl-CoA dehydrogenase-like protein n=1 Tax=Actinokineospora cianjurensis TaxID=585224 RepID=A0A421B0H3_9PSEU|nr:hypothetical protein [Actinokineospora cianjurensis]RLK55588.1 acyl-CoA dehydrogenase-like protein [Actinokineospora cianjurensis]
MSFYLGIARGALETARVYTVEKSRALLHGGQERSVDEPYVLDVYGDLTAKLWAVEAFADQVAAEGWAIHQDPDVVTERERGEHEVRVAAVKAHATEVALEITGGIFEVTGARATAAREGLDASGATSARTPCTARSPTSDARSGSSYYGTRSPNPPGTPDHWRLRCPRSSSSPAALRPPPAPRP